MQRSTGDTSGLRDRNTAAHGNDVRSARGSTTPDVFMLHVRPVHKYLYEYALMFHVSNACVESKFQPFSAGEVVRGGERADALPLPDTKLDQLGCQPLGHGYVDLKNVCLG